MGKWGVCGQYWSILDNISECVTIFDNIGKYLNVPYNVITLIRVS